MTPTNRSGSPGALSATLAAFSKAWRERDPELARHELRTLAAEAEALADREPLFPPTGVEQRQRIALARGKTQFAGQPPKEKGR